SFWAEHFKAIFATVTIAIPVAKILKIPGASFLFKWISGPFFKAIAMVGRGILRVFGKAGSAAITGGLAEIEKTFPRVANALLSLVTMSGKSFSKLPGRLSGIARGAMDAVVARIEGAGGAVGAAAARIVVA